MAGGAAAYATWLPSYPSVDHMFDLDEALTLPMNFPAAALPSTRTAEEVALPSATEADVNGVVCSICTEGFPPGEADGKRVTCGHVYHSGCISTWLSYCNSCPLCRAQVLVVNK